MCINFNGDRFKFYARRDSKEYNFFWKTLTSNHIVRKSCIIIFHRPARYYYYYYYVVTREIPITLCTIPIYIYILYARTLYRTSSSAHVCTMTAVYDMYMRVRTTCRRYTPKKVREPTPPIYGNNMHLHRRRRRNTAALYIIMLYLKYYIIISR